MSEYVDSNLVEKWIDAFMLTTTGYEVSSCECLIPSNTCRADEEAEHRAVNSALTTVLMGEFKQLMGEQNHLIADSS